MKPPRRLIVVGIALAAATALAVAVQGGRWWTVDDPELGAVSIGPVSSHRCFSGDCRASGLGWVAGGEGWQRAGQAAYAAALAAAALLVFSAAALAARRPIRPIARSGVVAAVTAGVAGAVFVALFPGVAGAELGRGVLLYTAGIGLGIAAQLLVLRHPAAPPPGPAGRRGELIQR